MKTISADFKKKLYKNIQNKDLKDLIGSMVNIDP